MGKITLSLVVIIINFSNHTYGQQTITWNKSGNGFWEVAANWSPAQVPTLSDTVVIDHDSVAIRNGVDAFAARIEVGDILLPCGLGIVSGGSLTISGSAENGLAISGDQGVFQNAGFLKFFELEFSAIKLTDGLFANTETGEIEITSHSTAPSIDISSNAQFNNSGKVSIDSNSIGIDNNGKIINNGVVCISHSTNYCLRNFGQVHNYGTMIFDSIESSGIETFDSLVNHVDASILMTNGNSTFVSNTFGHLINMGLLKLSNSSGLGLSNAGTVINSGHVLIDTTAGIRSSRDLINCDSGLIRIDSSNGKGLSTSSHLVNTGTIEILRTTQEGMENRGYFQNDGKIVIKHVHDSFQAGFINQDSIQNNGQIDISHCANHGLYNNFRDAVLINNDSIWIDSVGETGIRSRDGRINNTAWIQITNGINVGSDGIVLDKSVLDNSGHILIDQVSQVGLAAIALVPNSESVINLTSGEIEIRRVTEDAIRLLNQSKMTIEESATVKTSIINGLPLEVNLGAIVDCNGFLDLSN